jgi:hypothetical protein
MHRAASGAGSSAKVFQAALRTASGKPARCHLGLEQLSDLRREGDVNCFQFAAHGANLP